MIEASWAFAQQNDIRHGTREAARLAATNFDDANGIATEVCARMDVINPTQTPTVEFTPDNSADGSYGSLAVVEVSANAQTLTGILDPIFGGITIRSSLEFRVEEPAASATDWWNGGSVSTNTCS